jgi:hypothetical protein
LRWLLGRRPNDWPEQQHDAVSIVRGLIPIALLGMSAMFGIGFAWGGTFYGVGILALCSQTQPMRRVLTAKVTTVVVRLLWMAYLAYLAVRFIALEGEPRIGGQTPAVARFGSSHLFAAYLVAALVLLSITEFLLRPGKWPFENGVVRQILDFQPVVLSPLGSRFRRLVVWVAGFVAVYLGLTYALLPEYHHPVTYRKDSSRDMTPVAEATRGSGQGWLGVCCLIAAGLLFRVVTAERCTQCSRLVESTKSVRTGRTTPGKSLRPLFEGGEPPDNISFGQLQKWHRDRERREIPPMDEFVHVFRCPRCDHQWVGSHRFDREQERRAAGAEASGS